MSRVLPWITAILFLGCLALGGLVIRQKTEIAQINVHWGSAGKDAQKRITDLQHQLAEAKAAQAAAEKTPGAGTRDASTAPAAKSAGANGGPRIIHVSDILKEHPEYSALYAKQMRHNVDRMYGVTLDTLNLEPAQLSQLKTLLAERQMSSIDAQQAAEAAGLQRGTPEYQDAMKQATQETEQQLSSLLGNNADSLLVQLQVRNGIQTQVETSYRPDFAEGGAPLNPEQASSLVQAMADANYGGKDPSTRPADYNDPDPATGLTPHDNRIIDAASKMLTPAQVQILRTEQIDNTKMVSIMKAYNPSGGPVRFEP